MPSRSLLLVLMWLSLLVAYFDRVNISVAGPLMSRDLHLSPLTFGAALSAFSLGYAIMQTPGGGLADRFGTRNVLTTALLLWSLFTGLTAVAFSTVSLLVVRVLFGVGEGLENGAQFKLIADLFSSRERPFANGFFLTAVALGPAIITPLTVWALQTVGWRWLFVLCVVPGVVMAALVWRFVPHAGVVAPLEQRARAQTGAWRSALAYLPTWLVVAAYFGFNIALWAMLGWLPTYLASERHVNLSALGWASSLPYVAGVVGLIVVGWIGVRLDARFRPVLIAACYAIGGAGLAYAYAAPSLGASVAWLSVAGFGMFGGFGPIWAIALDIAPVNLRGAFSGFVNFTGQVAAIAAPIVVGALVKTTHTFAAGFDFMVAGLALAVLALLILQVRTLTAV